jgi:hypothetical protein
MVQGSSGLGKLTLAIELEVEVLLVATVEEGLCGGVEDARGLLALGVLIGREHGGDGLQVLGGGIKVEGPGALGGTGNGGRGSAGGESDDGGDGEEHGDGLRR